MKAAVVDAFDQVPRYCEFDDPVAQDGEVLVSVRAAALSQLVRAQASGKHYSSQSLPMVPGADGVGVLANGQRVYFAFPRRPLGAMAEKTVVDKAQIIQLPDAVDDITAAALANPGMSSWAALMRAQFQRGESVFINGANGVSGRLAIQIAKFLGAGRVIAAVRNLYCESDLRALGADSFIVLQQEQSALVADIRREIHQGVNVVLDYLWGAPAEVFLLAASGHGAIVAEPRIRFVNIGSSAGMTTSLNASVLRSSGLELIGSGLGSLSHVDLVQAVAGVLQITASQPLSIAVESKPLSTVESAWSNKSAARLVFTVDH